MRSLLPWHRFTLETAWTPADVAREIHRLSTQPPTLQGDERTGQRAVSEDGFTLHWLAEAPAIGRSPIVVAGRVQLTPVGTHVVVTMRLALPAMLLLFVAVPLLTVLSFAVSLAALVRHEGMVLLVWMMPFALWNGILHAFRRDALRGEALFRKFFPPVAPPVQGPFR